MIDFKLCHKTLLLFILGLSANGLYAEPVKTMYSNIELVSEYDSIASEAQPFNLGISLQPDPGWHVYWINPGDAGKELIAEWQFLGDDWLASEFEFPTPHVIPYDTLITYGYDESILLVTQITPPRDLSHLKTAHIAVDANWVVCDDEICVPERAQLAIALPVVEEIDSRVNPMFEEARKRLSSPVAWDAKFTLSGELVEIRIVPERRKSQFVDPYLFIESKDLVQYESQSVSEFNEGLFFTMQAARWSDRVDATNAVLAFTNAEGSPEAVELSLLRDNGNFVAVPVTTKETDAATSLFSITNPQTFIAAILAAFLGGILLNLMPCVFPILSLKAISVVESTGTAIGETRLNGLLYTAGILVSFLIIGCILLVIRASGSAVGWGFQLQSSLINVILALVMVAIGLNLLGVFEFGTRIMGLGSSVQFKSERTQTFLVGFLAVVVATPCVTPFMAPAIGWAFTQPVTTALTTLVALGFGLAFPYLVICYIPAIANLLPKPGAWMVVFRQFMAFPMLLTSIWLFWVVGRQLGETSMALGLLSAVILGFSLWVYGRASEGSKKTVWYGLASLGFIISIATVSVVDDYKESTTLASGSQEIDDSGFIESFDENLLREYINTNQPAFVYFTADWCITCKVNERVALDDEKVQTFLISNGIKVIEADWTKENPIITKWLEMYERVGVPMYLYFPVGSSITSASVLPQILSPEILIDEIEEANLTRSA